MDIGGRPQRIGSTEEAQCGIIADTGQRYNESKKTPEPHAVDHQRILRGFDPAIGDGVHNFQRFGRPEAQRGLEYDQTGRVMVAPTCKGLLLRR